MNSRRSRRHFQPVSLLSYNRRMQYRVLIEQDEDGIFIATVPSLPGCISQGATREEAIANAKEAIQGYVQSLRAHGEPIPPAITEEIIEVSG